MKTAALLVALAMGADLVTFALVVPLVGIEAELNPIMAEGYARFGIVMVALLKGTATLAIVLLVARVSRPGLRWGATALGMSLGLLGAFGNVSTWLIVART